MSEKDNSYYIGTTNNFANRIIDHNIRSSGKYTSKKRPWKLVLLKKYNCLTEAVKEEKRLKRCKNRKYLVQYIKTAQLDRAIPTLSG